MKNETDSRFVECEALLSSCPSVKQAVARLKRAQQDVAWDHMASLPLQGKSVGVIESAIEKKNVSLWSTTISGLSGTIFNFGHKALLQILPTASNLHQWKKIQDPQCMLCAKGFPQTNKHVLSNCSSNIALQRYTERHNAILQHIVQWLKSVIHPSQRLFADLVFNNSSINSTNELFTNLRPDIAI